jgi:3-methyl-2-oxobutanoate hydroxymethyltransferase
MSVHSLGSRPVSIHDLRTLKERGERFAMVTAYDYLSAQVLDEAGVPVLLVGDSLGMVVLGYDSTVPVTMEEMLHHTAAVRRGASRALVVGDMPFMSYQLSTEEGMRNAGRFLKEAGAHAVKLEGAGPVVELTARLTSTGIPVMAHLGLTPQRVNQIGGFKVQAKDDAAAERLLAEARELEDAGAFALVLECVPAEVGTTVSQALSIPTIGIGAGPGTDAQVLVYHDLLGLTAGRLPRFVKGYADLRGEITDAVKAFSAEVASGDYPGPEHTY